MVDYRSEFPPTSVVDIYFTNGYMITCAPSKYNGYAVAGMVLDLPLTIGNYYPKEDENYIYEVVIEQ